MQLPSHNPDVLTCIANLSNDEVFTPPDVANQMLDRLERAWAADNSGASIWEDPTVTFLDPSTKSGVFLREITERLIKGLEEKIPNLQERVDHVLTKQVYGIAITQLTGMLARRSVYCSKWANREHSICTQFETEQGNVWFERTEHAWAGGRSAYRLNPISGEEVKTLIGRQCKYCGASEDSYGRGSDLETHAYAFIHTKNIKKHVADIFGDRMKFDVVIGNPPYQLSDSGHGVSAKPIFQHFIKQAKELDPRYLCMIIPARWYSGGKGLDQFRSEMLGDERIVELHDFPDSREVFAGVDIAGGVCYFLWSAEHSGDTLVVSHQREKSFESNRKLLERGVDVFVRDNRALTILEKIAAVEVGPDYDSLMLPGEKNFASQVSARKPFGLPTNYRGAPDRQSDNDLKLFRSGGTDWIPRADVSAGHDFVDKWKVFTSKASNDHAGQPDKDGTRRVLGRTGILPPGTVVSETYILLGSFQSQEEALNCLSFATTRFFRFLVSLRSSTQDITKSRFLFVPTQDWKVEWDDEKLAEKYGLTADEVSLIESRIRQMEVD